MGIDKTHNIDNNLFGAPVGIDKCLLRFLIILFLYQIMCELFFIRPHFRH